ncbi:MAG: hypothetical protein J6A06_02460 [Fibrobacteraceae bacterium]|nr:hypothetical protein [Fibrobacteraceae bacterium]
MRKEENLEKKKIDFFKAYDEIAKEPFSHEDFLQYLKEKIVSAKVLENVPRELCLGLYDFYSEQQKNVFEFCDFKAHFKNKRIEKVWLKLSAIKEKIEDDVGKKNIEFVQKLADFIFAFKEKYSLDFFKRFFFVYDYEKSSTKCEENKEWLENHENYLKKIKRDEELDEVREWYKEQLEKITFDKLSEKDKSEFFRECFVAFACVSDGKKGHNGTWNKERKKIFLLGRLFNIHLLPLELIENNEKESLWNIAVTIKRNLDGKACATEEDIEKSKGIPKESKMRLSDEIAQGRAGSRVSTEWIREQGTPWDLSKNFGLKVNNLPLELKKNIEKLSERSFQNRADKFLGERGILTKNEMAEKLPQFLENMKNEISENVKRDVPLENMKKPEISLKILCLSGKIELMKIFIDNYLLFKGFEDAGINEKNISSSPKFLSIFQSCQKKGKR